MREHFVSTTIEAPSAVVWKELSDIAQWPTWTPTVVEARVLNDAALGPGERVYLRQPKLRDAIWTVTRWQPEERFTWQSTYPGVKIEGDHILIPISQSTEVHFRLTISGWLSALALKFVGELSRSYLEIEAGSLKALCEAQFLRCPSGGS
jgi:uncharacterized membrane protein